MTGIDREEKGRGEEWSSGRRLWGEEGRGEKRGEENRWEKREEGTGERREREEEKEEKSEWEERE